MGASKPPDRTTPRPDCVTNDKNDGKVGPPDAAGRSHPAEEEEEEAEGASRAAAAGAPSDPSIADSAGAAGVHAPREEMQTSGGVPSVRLGEMAARETTAQQRLGLCGLVGSGRADKGRKGTAPENLIFKSMGKALNQTMALHVSRQL